MPVLRTWLKSGWLELIISVLFAAVEAATIAPWLHLLGGIFGDVNAPIPSPVGIWLVALVTFWLARGLIIGGWDIATARLIGLGTWVVMLILWFVASTGHGLISLVDGIFSPNGRTWALIIVSVLAWWRGMMLGAEPAPFSGEIVRGMLLRGVASMALILVIGAAVGGQMGHHLLDSAGIALPVILIGGLIATAAVQVRLSRTRVKASDKEGLGWVGASTGIAIGIVLIGLIFATIAGPHVWAQIFHPIGVVLDLIYKGLYYALLGLTYAAFILLWPFFWIFDHLTGNAPKKPPVQQQAGKPNNQLKAVQRAHEFFPPWAIHAIEIALIVIVVAIILWLMLRSMRRFREKQAETAVEEEHESVWSSDIALAQLRGWLKGLRPTGGLPIRRSRFDLENAPITVRDAYRHVLVFAARRGHSREPVESPGDYAGRMDKTPGWRASSDPLERLTGRYLGARYGEENDAGPDAQLAREEWEAIRQHLREEG